jgi:hypothetical protein
MPVFVAVPIAMSMVTMAMTAVAVAAAMFCKGFGRQHQRS